ncbi:hypothetical protein EGW08_009585, partial [Elysia chlorotica]
MWFTTKTGREALKRLTPASPRGLQRVCYSMHSSYSEIQDLVSYLQPRHVWPNVVPASDDGPQQVQDRLNSFLEKAHPLRPGSTRTEDGQPETVSRGLDLVNTERRPQTSSLFRFVPNDSESSEGCVFDTQDLVEHKAPDTNGADVDQKCGGSKKLSQENWVTEDQPVVCPGGEDTDLDFHPRLSQKNIDNDNDDLPVVCPDVGGEEADSDFHLRLSQDSYSSQESQHTPDSSQDKGQIQSTHFTH